MAKTFKPFVAPAKANAPIPIAIPREAFLLLQVALLQQQLWRTQGVALQQQVQSAMVVAGLDPAGRYTLDEATLTATPQGPPAAVAR